MEKTHVSEIEIRHRVTCPMELLLIPGSRMQHVPATLAVLGLTCSILWLSMAKVWEAYHQVCFGSLLNISGTRRPVQS